MYWNHRVLASEQNGEIYFQIHEVYYDKNDKPDGYTKNSISVGGENIKEINWTLNKIKKCLKEPILWAGSKFPKEFKR